MPPVTRRTEREYEAQLAEIYGPPIVISSSESESDDSLKDGFISQRRKRRKSTRQFANSSRPHKKKPAMTKPAPTVTTTDHTSANTSIESTRSISTKAHKPVTTVLKFPNVLRTSKQSPPRPNRSSTRSNRSSATPRSSSTIPDNVGLSEILEQEKLAQENLPQEKSAQENLVQENLPQEKSAEESEQPRRFRRVVESDSNSDKNYKEDDDEDGAPYRPSRRRPHSNRATTRKRTISPRSRTSRHSSRNKSTTSSSHNDTTEPIVNNSRPNKSPTPSTHYTSDEQRSVSQDAPVVLQTVRNTDDLTEITHTAYEDQPSRPLRPVAKEKSSAYDRRINAGSMATRTRATAKRILLDESTGEPLRVFVTYQTKNRLKYALLVKQLTNKDLLTQPRSDSLNLAESDYVNKLAILPLLNTFKFYDVELLQCSANLGYMPSRETYLIYDPEKDKMERQERIIEKVQIVDDEDQTPIIKAEPKDDYPSYVRRLEVTAKKPKSLKPQSITPSVSDLNQGSKSTKEPTPITVAPPKPSQLLTEPEITPLAEPQAKNSAHDNISSKVTTEVQKKKENKVQLKPTEGNYKTNL